MRVIFEMPATGFGYFPGLAKPVEIEVGELAPAVASEIEELVAAARFFERPAPAGAPARGAADCRQYAVTVEEDGRRRTLRLSEPIGDRELQRLIHCLEVTAKALRGR
jgi:hypothetical protein